MVGWPKGATFLRRATETSKPGVVLSFGKIRHNPNCSFTCNPHASQNLAIKRKGRLESTFRGMSYIILFAYESEAPELADHSLQEYSLILDSSFQKSCSGTEDFLLLFGYFKSTYVHLRLERLSQQLSHLSNLDSF